MDIDELKKINADKNIKGIEDESFRQYGAIVRNLDLSFMNSYVEKNVSIPKNGNEYIASVKKLKKWM